MAQEYIHMEMVIRGAVPKSVRKAIGHTHGRTP